MITVEGGSDNGLNFYQGSANNLNDTTSSTSQINVIKKFMAALDKSTKTNAKDMLDEAIQACSSFTGINDAINHFLNDFNTYGSSKFLSERCGIILGNNDTGAVTGSDMGGTTTKTAKSIVDETGSLDTSFTEDSFSIKGVTFTLSGNYSSLSAAQKLIWQGLYTWWAGGALQLIEDSYGTNFGFSSNSSATVNNITVNFTTEDNGALAWVGHNYSNGQANSLSLTVNMQYYSTITSLDNNKDGGSSTSGSLYLDRVLAHEMTHAVMAANINYFSSLPLFIIEGMAELTHGIDDVRGSISTLANNYSDLSKSVSVEAADSSYKSDYAYSAGYMFLHYLAKQAYSTDNAYIYGTTSNDVDTKKYKKAIHCTVSNKIVNALSGNDSIINDGNDVTIIGGTGNDSISGSGIRQVIQYANGDGKDIITNFTTADTINITDGEISTSSLKKKNVVLKVGKGTITLKNGKGTIVNYLDSSGNLHQNIYGNGTITMLGSDSGETLTAWAKADSINAGSGEDTLIGGKGADTLTGGAGADVFYYSSGDGNDIITDYEVGTDVIKLASGAITKAAVVKKAQNDISLTVGKGNIKITNGTGKKITIIDAAGNITKQTFGAQTLNIIDGDGSTINAAVDAVVETIVASSRTEDLSLSANGKANTIKLGTGNTTLTTGKGNDTVEFIGGKAYITDYATGADVLKFNEDFTAKISGQDFIFTTDKGTLTVHGAVNKKNKSQKITVVDKAGVKSSQIYGSTSVTVANGDGDTVSVENNTDVTVVNAAKRSKSVWLIGNSNDNTIKGGTKADTIQALDGNDYVTGGKGNDMFIYSGGNDTIADYAVGKGNSDQITLSGAAFDTYSISGKNAILTFKDTTSTLTILNAKDKTVTIDGTAKLLNDINEKIFTKKDAVTAYTADNDVVTINAAANTAAIYITGNDKANIIKGSSKADTLAGGAGDDTLTGGKGADTFIYSSGKDSITDYQVGTDIVSIGSAIQSASYDNRDLVLKFDDSNTLTITNAKTKKGVAQKITINESGKTTSQAYGVDTLTVGATDGDTVDLSKAVNSIVKTVNASSRKAANPITIIGNTQTLEITGSKGKDNINLSSETNRGRATITYTLGDDVITNFKTDDILNLSKNQKFASATKVSETHYTVKINNKKNTNIGTLDISGLSAFSTTAESTTSYQGEGSDSGTTYYDVTSYVNIGGNKIAYNVATKVTKVEAAYEERYIEEHNEQFEGTFNNNEWFEDTIVENELFEDTLIASADDLSEISSITDNKYSIAINYSSSKSGTLEHLGEVVTAKPNNSRSAMRTGIRI